MPRGLKFSLTLLVIGAVAGGALALVEVGTRERIEKNRGRKLEAAFADVPGYASFRGVGERPGASSGARPAPLYFELLGADGAVVALAASARCPGSYNGRDPVTVIAVTDPECTKLILVRTPGNNETPGLGTRLSESLPRNTLFGRLTGQADRAGPEIYPFLGQFSGREVAALGDYAGKSTFSAIGEATAAGRDGFDAVSGATVSSRAVLAGVREAVRSISEARAAGAPQLPSQPQP